MSRPRLAARGVQRLRYCFSLALGCGDVVGLHLLDGDLVSGRMAADFRLAQRGGDDLLDHHVVELDDARD